MAAQTQNPLPSWIHVAAAILAAVAAGLPNVLPMLGPYAPFVSAGVGGLAYLMGLIQPQPASLAAK